ncbi:hypothetical protein COU91_00160 [Candidatus Saccharibacteria bacterium CG10_big_fil_rev_8_21_14_0_10_47_8]|nr:MAG: hypothetical protein COU91_00160 [Candidatus Saccharibacteria bacterium CG10_big_fil_rev_8_21_14_0_10_47_8]
MGYNKSVNIIGIGGTDGSGKDTVGQLLAEKHGYLFLTVTDLLREEAKKRNLPMERQSYRQISAEWRRYHGMAVLIDYALQKFKSLKEKYQGLVVASLRHPAEADRIHRLGGEVVWVDADPRVRYDRITSRNRGTEDHITYEEFVAEEQAQMQHSGDQATLNLSSVRAKTDIFLTNNGNDIEKFKDAAEKALSGLLK